MRSGSGGGRGGVTCSPSPSLWRHSAGSMRGEPQQQRSARRPSSPIHYNTTTTHSPAPAVLHPCFLLHFLMSNGWQIDFQTQLLSNCKIVALTARWKLRDEQLHCQHGVNEKWRHVERKETLLELAHTINCYRVGRRYLRVLLQICYDTEQ